MLRDSDIELEEEAEDLVRLFETLLKRRRRGNVIRLSDRCRHARAAALVPRPATCSVVPEDVDEVDGILGLADIAAGDRRGPAGPAVPALHAALSRADQGLRRRLLRRDPGTRTSSSTTPTRASTWWCSSCARRRAIPAVVAIKQTLYRTSENSPIVAALIEAAEAGKSVTALVELKARFDEERNIRWARDLERAGVQVVYGFIELKTHAKVSLVVRREAEGLRTYCHFGTGNYHPITAQDLHRPLVLHLRSGAGPRRRQGRSTT